MKKYRFILSLLSSLMVMFVVSACKKVEEPVLTSISINSENVKKEYFQNEKLNLTGMKVIAKYSNGTDVEVEKYSVTPSDNTVLSDIGKKTITVTYEDKSDSFEIIVSKNYLSVVSIEVPEYEDVTDLLFFEEEEFKTDSGFETYIWFLDGTPLSNTVNTYTPDLLSIKPGVHELLVIVKDDKGNSYSASATFVIEI